MMRMLPKLLFAVAAAGALPGCGPDRPRDLIHFSDMDRAVVVQQSRYGSYPIYHTVPGGMVYSRQVRSGYISTGGVGGAYIYTGSGAPVFSGRVVFGRYGGRGHVRIGGRGHRPGGRPGGHTGGRHGGRRR